MGALAGLPFAGVAGAVLPGPFWTGVVWAQTCLAGSTKAIAAAKTSQRGSKRFFLVIILGIPCLHSRAVCKRIQRLEAVRRCRQPVGAALPTVKTILNCIGHARYYRFVDFHGYLSTECRAACGFAGSIATADGRGSSAGQA